mgnify:CR=1 FL=1
MSNQLLGLKSRVSKTVVKTFIRLFSIFVSIIFSSFTILFIFLDLAVGILSFIGFSIVFKLSNENSER